VKAHVPFHADDDVTLYHGDACDVLATWSPQSVDAIVTSPPYADQRGYGGAKPDDYAEWFRPFLAEMLRVLKPTGGLMLNLGRVMRDGEEHPYMDEVKAAARSLGWRHIDTIVWEKPNAAPMSAACYLHSKHELVFWLAPTIGAYRGYTKETRAPHARSSVGRIGRSYAKKDDERYAKHGTRKALHPDGARPTTVFRCAIAQERVDHPAIMALKLARHLVCLSCPPGSLVLDPFMGSGTTALAARMHGRRAVGVELHEQHLRTAVTRLAEPQQTALLEGVA
jgi:DNA modification methylase